MITILIFVPLLVNSIALFVNRRIDGREEGLNPLDDNVKLDIISDVACPWCIIGRKHAVQAITKMGLGNMVEIAEYRF